MSALSEPKLVVLSRNKADKDAAHLAEIVTKLKEAGVSFVVEEGLCF